jgi:signal transduction histidine kinase/ActR/RegA family two-component response regulator
MVSRYGLAIVSVLLAMWARMALTPWLADHSPFSTFFVAVMVTATYGGFGPAMLATLLGAAASLFYFKPPEAEIPGRGVEYLLGLVLYLVSGMVLALLCESLRGARRRSEVHAEQAVARQHQLEKEIAQRARTERLNTELYHEVQEANRRKDEFLAMLAHELRNPLAPIRNAAQVMRLINPPDARLAWSRDVIDRQVEHLSRLVDDLLDVSRLLRGRVRLQLREVDLAEAINQAVEASRPIIDAHGHQLAVALPQTQVRLHADLTRLTQVFVNLLNNAAKYTDAGGRIRVQAECAGAEVVVRVRDTGRGMPADLLPHVFDLFTQGERTLARAEGGLGIGLTLARNLVEMHGGRIEAFSDGPGKGSEFAVHLPVMPATVAASPNSAHTSGETPVTHACRILVVDDKPDAADSLALLLRVIGHEVRTAYSGPAALEAARQFAPEIIFLDLGMPGMDGYQVAQRLRRQHRPENLMLVALTGYNQEEDVRHCREAGFDAHLCKPADLDAVQHILESWCEQHGPAVSCAR